MSSTANVQPAPTAQRLAAVVPGRSPSMALVSLSTRAVYSPTAALTTFPRTFHSSRTPASRASARHAVGSASMCHGRILKPPTLPCAAAAAKMDRARASAAVLLRR